MDIFILSSSGHDSVKWDPDDQEDVKRARAEIQRYKDQGYTFFRVVGDPRSGEGEIIVGRVEDPITPPPTAGVPEEAGKPKKVRTVGVRRMGAG